MHNLQPLGSENGIITAIVTQGTPELGIKLPAEATASFETYYSFLKECRRSVNLTSVKGEEDVARLHFLDSLALYSTSEFKNARVIDIGSGAGFPGIPLKIADTSIDLTVLDATGKRVAFLSNLCAALNINAACIHARAEEASRKPDFRDCYDIAVSRAVARLNVLCELCLPFVRIGGVFIAMKGVDSADELEEAFNAITTLGAKLLNCYDYTIPGTDITHRAIIIKKASGTPDKYPRRYAKAQKTPL